MSEDERERLLAWVERLAEFLARDGVPPIAGRCLGWLMVCDPPEQSAAEIAEAIGASRASLTTNMQILTAMGFVAKGSRPGERTAYYRVHDHAWEQVVSRQVASLNAFRDLAGDGLTLLGDEPDRSSRVRDAFDAFDWMTKVFATAPPLASRKENRR